MGGCHEWEKNFFYLYIPNRLLISSAFVRPDDRHAIVSRLLTKIKSDIIISKTLFCRKYVSNWNKQKLLKTDSKVKRKIKLIAYFIYQICFFRTTSKLKIYDAR